MRRASETGLLLRNGVNLILAAVALADPEPGVTALGHRLLAALFLWSLYRLWTRSVRLMPMGIDYVFVLLTSGLMAQIHPAPHFQSVLSVQHGIAGTAVIGFTVAASAKMSLLLTTGIAAAYAWGSATIVGADNVWTVPALYLFVIVWIVVAWIRRTLFHAAEAVDRSRADRHRAQLRQDVSDAVRAYDHEQLALLHDTAASTLLMVGEGVAESPQRLAAQARRDLTLLATRPSTPAPSRLELVAALRDCTRYLRTPARFSGATKVSLESETVNAVVAATREAMNNVDRHAQATILHISIDADTVLLEDDGVGFDVHARRSGHGLTESILGRMKRVGGHARIESTPGIGTKIELSWDDPGAGRQVTMDDPEQLIARLCQRYGWALTGYALTNLGWAVPLSILGGASAATTIALGTIAALATLMSVPGIRRKRWTKAHTPAIAALAAVGLIQPFILTPDLFAAQANWCQASIGWCMVPLVLVLSVRRGTALVATYWLCQATVEILLAPTSFTLVNIGLGSACILGVQVFAIVFNGLLRDAGHEAHHEALIEQRLHTRLTVSTALHAEYSRRYATLIENVVNVLRELTQDEPVNVDLARRARIESRKLRMLFDQSSTFDHPLMREVRRAVDTAEDRGVSVTMAVCGQPPEHIAESQIISMTSTLEQILQACQGSVRLTVADDGDRLSISVVCEETDPAATLITEDSNRHGASVEYAGTGSTAWFLIQPSSYPRDRDALALGAG